MYLLQFYKIYKKGYKEIYKIIFYKLFENERLKHFVYFFKNFNSRNTNRF